MHTHGSFDGQSKSNFTAASALSLNLSNLAQNQSSELDSTLACYMHYCLTTVTVSWTTRSLLLNPT